MGPRMFIRGIDGTLLMGERRLLVLQWGRGCSSAESTACAPPITCRIAASMGPRMFIRGIRATDCHFDVLYA